MLAQLLTLHSFIKVNTQVLAARGASGNAVQRLAGDPHDAAMMVGAGHIQKILITRGASPG